MSREVKTSFFRVGDPRGGAVDRLETEVSGGTSTRSVGTGVDVLREEQGLARLLLPVFRREELGRVPVETCIPVLHGLE